MRIGSLDLPEWLTPVQPAGLESQSLWRTLRVILLCTLAVGAAVSFNVVDLPDRIGLWLMMAAVFVALVVNHRGSPEWAANLGLGSLLIYAGAMTWIARDGFRSINFYLLACLLIMGALLLRPAAYTIFATVVLAIIGAVGFNEMRFVAHGGLMRRSTTTLPLVFEVECIFGIAALAGGMLARNMHRNLLRISETSRELASANVALQSSEGRLRSLIELAADAIYITDPAGRIIDANRRGCALCGLDKADLDGLPITSLFPAERPSSQPMSLERLKSGSDAAFGAEMRGPNGAVVAVELTAKPMPDGAIQVICSDITERLRAEEHLLHMQKLESIGLLAGGVAHDFNNLLTVINGYSDLLLKGADEDTPQRSRLLQISRAGKRAAGLTQQLLAFSRKQMIEPRRHNLNEEIAESEEMLRRLVSENIEFTTALDPTLGDVVADAGQIHQVLMNLAVNARDAMPDGGRLHIETRNVQLGASREMPEAVPPGNYIQLTVSDNGIGMDEATRARVFEPFFTTKPKGSGTGLGLSTVYGIVRQSQGWITIDSEPGQGTTVTIYLPRTNAPSVESEDAAPAGGLQGSETVLVVEDQADVRDFACCVLRTLGYRVLDAADGAEAIRVAQTAQEPIHLLLSDVIMPGMTGREAAAQVQLLHPRIRVLFMSGYTDDMVGRRSVMLQGLAHVAKPFSPDELGAKVRAVLDGA
jgi:two-component system cell cycle sensor histidine kinase/response regulator CckA